MAAFAVWFLLARMLVGIPAQHPLAARVAMFTGVLGAALGVIAMLLHVADDLREKSLALRGLAIARLGFVLPVGLLVSSAMLGEPLPWQQWAGLWGAAGTIVLALVPAIVRARGMWVPRITLLLLLVGELVELGWPPAHLAFAPGTAVPTLFGKLGAVSEACAFLGAILALTWSLFSTRYTAGWWRARVFLPLPIVTSTVMSFLMTTLPPRRALIAARNAFGVRFDLIWDDGQLAAFSMPGLIAYLLIPELLVGAAAISVAAIGVDRGSAARRSLGWLAILFAGFGAIRATGPMDPIRLVLVSLGAILLERAVVRELEDRKTPRAAN